MRQGACYRPITSSAGDSRIFEAWDGSGEGAVVLDWSGPYQGMGQGQGAKNDGSVEMHYLIVIGTNYESQELVHELILVIFMNMPMDVCFCATLIC